MLDLAIRGPLERADLPGLFARVCALLENGGLQRSGGSHAGGASRAVRCDVTGIPADAVAVDALARLQLAARRHRCQVWLCGASDELNALVAFAGLSELLPAEPTRPAGPGDRTAGTGSPWPGRT